jgi:hypothetical protein
MDILRIKYMSKIKVIFKSLIVILVILTLPASPLFDIASLSAAPAENTCGPVCCCCGDTPDDISPENSQGMAAKCGCNMNESEPAEDIPPLTASNLSKDNEITITFVDHFFKTIDLNSRNNVFKTDVIYDDTGPPLYLVNASFLI